MTPTGRVLLRDGEPVLVQSREFRAPIEDVWAAVTESERLARWIGEWTGDPATGSVEFRMTYEGEGHAAETMEIRVCEPPRRLHLTSYAGEQVWRIDLDLTHADGVTTLTLTQPGVDPDEVASIGPGWDYYLDRMVDAETGADPATRDFDDYYPATAAHYSDQAAAAR